MKYIKEGFTPPFMQQQVFASSIDFRPNTESVDNQKSQGSCVAHGAQTMLEIMYERAGIKIDFSRQYLYYYVRLYGGTLGMLSGGGFTSQIGQIVDQAGCCLESTWEYKPSNDGIEPDEESKTEARRLIPQGSTKFKQLTGMRDVKQALNQGKPVTITMYVTPQWMNGLGKNWRTHTWDMLESPIGLHNTTIIGYDDAVNRYLVENQYGDLWGDGGFFGLPYELFNNSNCVLDCFCFDELAVPAIPDSVYKQEDIPTFNTSTNVLTLPTVYYFPGDFGGAVLFKNVCLKLTTFGTVTTNDEMVMGIDNFIQRKTWNSDIPRMGLPKVIIDGVLHDRVKLVGLDFEILSGELN